jgi:hypothetical protein
MNLYLLSQTKNNRYDTYSDCVVVAENEAEARKIHPRLPPLEPGVEDWKVNSYWGQWTMPENVKVELVGIAADGLKPGTVVCSSFHAG